MLCLREVMAETELKIRKIHRVFLKLCNKFNYFHPNFELLKYQVGVCLGKFHVEYGKNTQKNRRGGGYKPKNGPN